MSRGRLIWGVRGSLIAYVDALEDGRVTTSGLLAGEAFVFPSTGMPSAAWFGGSVVIDGWGGLLHVEVHGPRVERRAGGLVLSIGTDERLPTRTDVAALSPVPASDPDRYRAVLTVAGENWLPSQYSAGDPLDDVILVGTRPPVEVRPPGPSPDTVT